MKNCKRSINLHQKIIFRISYPNQNILRESPNMIHRISESGFNYFTQNLKKLITDVR